jgi:hypothetical protein
MAKREPKNTNVVPLPGQNETERRKIRQSNDRDQAHERRGEPSRHNQGYDEAADGTPAPDVDRVVDE